MKVISVKLVKASYDCAVCNKGTNIRLSESSVKNDVYLCLIHLLKWEEEMIPSLKKIKYIKDI